jgi:hypothetical protein
MPGAVKCPLQCDSFEAACANDHEDCRQKWHFALLKEAWPQIYPQSECLATRESLEEAHRCSGLNWGPEFTASAAKKGNLAWLRYLHTSGCPWGVTTCHSAAEGGSLGCLQYAHENSCPWSSGTANFAAISGSLECLCYAHEHGCPWTKKTCYLAARWGHLECLRYAHEHGCPWDGQEVLFAATHLVCFEMEQVAFDTASQHSLACVRYTLEVMGCQWHPTGFESLIAFLDGSYLVLEYIHAHGSPLSPKLVEYVHPRNAGSARLLGEQPTEHLRKCRARCLLLLHIYSKGFDAKCWETPVGRTALQLMETRRAALTQAVVFVGVGISGGTQMNGEHMAVTRLPSDVAEQILRYARLSL